MLGNYLKCSFEGFLTEQRRRGPFQSLPFCDSGSCTVYALTKAVVFLGHPRGECCQTSRDKVQSERFKLLRSEERGWRASGWTWYSEGEKEMSQVTVN